LVVGLVVVLEGTLVALLVAVVLLVAPLEAVPLVATPVELAALPLPL